MATFRPHQYIWIFIMGCYIGYGVETLWCLIKNGYPPQYSPEVFRKVMEQVENFEENQ